MGPEDDEIDSQIFGKGDDLRSCMPLPEICGEWNIRRISLHSSGFENFFAFLLQNTIDNLECVVHGKG